MTQACVTGSCECGKTHFEIEGEPLFRAHCHCSICQEYHQADYADFMAFRRRKVHWDAKVPQSLKAYKQPPFLRRGHCTECGSTSLETLTLPPFPRLILIPTKRLPKSLPRPTPSLHMFYDCRHADIEDNIPKFSGYLSSQIGFARVLKNALARNC
ncbi:MAG: GFA family protein [Mangrovicoccus sp.]|nr:GFA family protein [Mangrovicoccus sp.]